MKKSYEKLIREQSWFYEQAASDWMDGLFIGNGNLGVVAYAPGHLEWVLNKVDVFDPTYNEALSKKMLPHSEVMRRVNAADVKNSLFMQDLEAVPGAGSPIRNTLSAAKLRLRFWPGLGWAAPPMPQTSQELSLWDGVLTEKMDSHNFHAQAEMFVVRNSGVFCMQITEPGSAAADRPHFFELLRPAADFLEEPIWQQQGDVCAFLQKLPGRKHSYAVAIKTVPRNGGSAASLQRNVKNCSALVQRGDTEVFVSVKSSLECKNPLLAAQEEVEHYAQIGFARLKELHTIFYHQYWDNAYADFGRYKKMQKYFTFALYELSAAYAKAPMPGLNGLAYGPVNEQHPGVSFQAYTHDQNVQIPAMPFFPLNRTHLVEVIADTYLNRLSTLRRHTRKLFNAPGVFLPLQMNQLCQEYPTRHYRYTICGSAYSGMILAMAWKFSRDEELLRNKLYKLLREFTLFYCSIMQLGEDGRYHLDWSIPPEIFSFTRDEAATVSMFKVVLETTIETSRILKKDAQHRKHWQHVLDHYPEICLTAGGALWAGPDIPEDHYFFGGHLLYAYFPAGITDDCNIARKTLELIAQDSIERSFADFADRNHPNHEWSMFLQTATRLFCGDQPGGWAGTMRFLELFGKENGLFSHDPVLIGDPAESEANEQRNYHKLQRNRRWTDRTILQLDNPEIPRSITVTPNINAKRLAPPVLEGASAFLYLAAAALLQSRNGLIKVFPGVPEDFSGSFERLLAEGGVEVSGRMDKGSVKWVTLKARETGCYKLLDPFRPGAEVLIVKLQAGRSVTLKRDAGSR